MKNIVTNCYIRKITSIADIVNGKQEIQRANNSNGVIWKFIEVSKTRLLDALKENYVCCVKTNTGKFIEVNKDTLEKFIIE